MSEPRRPPPPKSYIPLDLSNGPPKLPPRPPAGERRAPHRQELTDPPDYSPPPPPESDEEEEKETPLPAWMNVQPFPHSQSKKTQQSVQEQQAPPCQAPPRGGPHPPPSRPSRPPAANTPPPETLSHPPTPTESHSPRPRPRAASASSSSRPQAPSRAKKRRQITIVSAQPMVGNTVPLPTSPTGAPPTAPPRTHPPPSQISAPPPSSLPPSSQPPSSHPPSSQPPSSLPPSSQPPSSHPPSSQPPSSQSPRAPSRKAPTRPPPSKKAPPPSPSSSHTIPHRPFGEKEETEEKEKAKEAAETTPSPAPPSRKGEREAEGKKAALKRSRTLPAQVKDPPAHVDSPEKQRKPHHRPAPPKPAPYSSSKAAAQRPARPPPSVSPQPPPSVQAQQKASGTRKSPSEEVEGGIRIISARGVTKSQPKGRNKLPKQLTEPTLQSSPESPTSPVPSESEGGKATPEVVKRDTAGKDRAGQVAGIKVPPPKPVRQLSEEASGAAAEGVAGQPPVAAPRKVPPAPVTREGEEEEESPPPTERPVAPPRRADNKKHEREQPSKPPVAEQRAPRQPAGQGREGAGHAPSKPSRPRPPAAGPVRPLRRSREGESPSPTKPGVPPEQGTVEEQPKDTTSGEERERQPQMSMRVATEKEKQAQPVKPVSEIGKPPVPKARKAEPQTEDSPSQKPLPTMSSLKTGGAESQEKSAKPEKPALPRVARQPGRPAEPAASSAEEVVRKTAEKTEGTGDGMPPGTPPAPPTHPPALQRPDKVPAESEKKPMPVSRPSKPPSPSPLQKHPPSRTADRQPLQGTQGGHDEATVHDPAMKRAGRPAKPPAPHLPHPAEEVCEREGRTEPEPRERKSTLERSSKPPKPPGPRAPHAAQRKEHGQDTLEEKPAEDRAPAERPAKPPAPRAPHPTQRKEHADKQTEEEKAPTEKPTKSLTPQSFDQTEHDETERQITTREKPEEDKSRPSKPPKPPAPRAPHPTRKEHGQDTPEETPAEDRAPAERPAKPPAPRAPHPTRKEHGQDTPEETPAEDRAPAERPAKPPAPRAPHPTQRKEHGQDTPEETPAEDRAPAERPAKPPAPRAPHPTQRKEHGQDTPEETPAEDRAPAERPAKPPAPRAPHPTQRKEHGQDTPEETPAEDRAPAERPAKPPAPRAPHPTQRKADSTDKQQTTGEDRTAVERPSKPPGPAPQAPPPATDHHVSQPSAEEHAQAPAQSGGPVGGAGVEKPAQPISPPIPPVRHVAKEHTPEQRLEGAGEQPGGKGGRPAKPRPPPPVRQRTEEMVGKEGANVKDTRGASSAGEDGPSSVPAKPLQPKQRVPHQVTAEHTVEEKIQEEHRPKPASSEAEEQGRPADTTIAIHPPRAEEEVSPVVSAEAQSRGGGEGPLTGEGSGVPEEEGSRSIEEAVNKETPQEHKPAADHSPEVVLRRAAKTGDIKPATRSKPPRPMSMPPGRLSKPAKPPPPSSRPARPPSIAAPQSKPPKPTKGPSRPAQGPSRPAQPQSSARSPTADLNVPPQLPPRPGPGHLLYKYVCAEPHGIAINNHEPSDPDELAYEEGDVIELIERVDKRWFFARNADLDMMEGVVPARDLRIVKKLPGESTVQGFEEGPCAVAMHAFQGQSMDELTFKAGDLIMLKTRVGAEWLRGRLLSGEEGIFPKKFVEIVEDLPPGAVETLVQSTVEVHGPHCVVLYEFTAAGPGELSIFTGDTVELLERVGKEWLKGRLRGEEGIFPAEFVEVKVDLPPNKEGERESGGGGVEGGNMSKALYDFDGQEGELSFKAGDRIKVVSRVNEDWVEGELQDRLGIFPASFVDHLPPDLPKKAEKTEPKGGSKEGKPTGMCEALFDFTAENSGELTFTAGEVIETTDWVNEEWLSGRIGTREGIFPLGFVKVLVELPKPSTTQSSVQKGLTHVTQLDDSLLPRAEAVCDFRANDSSELSFQVGDILNLLEKVEGDRYSGENTRTGKFGDFPASHVRVIVPLP